MQLIDSVEFDVVIPGPEQGLELGIIPAGAEDVVIALTVDGDPGMADITLRDEDGDLLAFTSYFWGYPSFNYIVDEMIVTTLMDTVLGGPEVEYVYLDGVVPYDITVTVSNLTGGPSAGSIEWFSGADVPAALEPFAVEPSAAGTVDFIVGTNTIQTLGYVPAGSENILIEMDATGNVSLQIVGDGELLVGGTTSGPGLLWGPTQQSVEWNGVTITYSGFADAGKEWVYIEGELSNLLKLTVDIKPEAIFSDGSGTLSWTVDAEFPEAEPDDGLPIPTEGDDVLLGDDDDNFLSGLGGDDTLSGLGGADFLSGGEGNDTLFGGDGDDTLKGDTFGGAPGDNVLYGGAGDDELEGSIGNDLLDGGAGDDRLTVRGGDNTLIGGAGNDNLSGGSSGIDTAVFNVSSDAFNLTVYLPDFGQGLAQISSAEGNDRLYGIEFIQFTDVTLSFADLAAYADGGSGSGDEGVMAGTAGDDTLTGASGNDVIDGHAGDDWAYGAAGADFIDGGDGDDIVLGGGDGDTLHGGDGADHLEGGEGDDMIMGGDGDDTLYGGDGADYLEGGTGNDLFIIDFGEDTSSNENDLVVVVDSDADAFVF
jgi:Ca2+-binding RTX toxin-like protein